MKRIFFLALLALSLAACGGSSGSSSSSTGNVMGVVTDMNGTVVQGVTVAAVGTSSTTTTDANGYFNISDLSESNYQVISFTKSGYATGSQIAQVVSGLGDFLRVTISAVGTSQSVTAAGGTVADGTTSIDIPANAFKDSTGAAYTGTATVELTSFDPAATTAGLDAFPGEYVGVTDTASPAATSSPLVSYGYSTMTATDPLTGNALTLNGNVTFTMPIPTAMQASAPDTIYLWHYDTTTGIWARSVTATKTGTTYVGTITSFSTWNYDVAYSAAYVTGTVTDCSTTLPIQGARVYVVGTGWKSGETATDSNGTFPNPNAFYTGAEGWKGIPVQPSAAFTIYAEKNGYKSTTQSGTGPTAGNVTTINICIYTIAGTYSGSYSGVDSGTFSMTVSETGLITGSGTSASSDIGGFDLSGHVTKDGAITMGAVNIHNATFTGTINGQTGAMSGTWTSDSGGGTFSGSK